MKSKRSLLLSAAISGLVVGAAGTSLASCESGRTSASQAALEKHACKGMNSCSGKGGCKTGDNGCAGKNSCKGKGGCATVDHHGCAGHNSCKNLGGCKSAGGCAGKNECAGKGGCAVPVKH